MKKIVWIVVVAAIALAAFILTKRPADEEGILGGNQETVSPTPTPSAKISKKAAPKTGGEIAGQSMRWLPNTPPAEFSLTSGASRFRAVRLLKTARA
ncbi:MAG: hypothetical protein UW71_C0035G0002 [Parcubacteria group bacterium GW2011_GWB1_44_7]|nr:MAG: hypothetical protein UW71_C0035G0002 [Parcubacteria group bacterium GW2011_GWB1_44_7]